MDSESTIEPPKLSSPSKRQFLQTSAKIGAVTAAGALLGHEIKRAENVTLDTPQGTFVPIYENHDVGIKPSEDIPEDLDIFFREGHGLTTRSGDKVISSVADFYINPDKRARLFTDEVLEYLHKNNIKIGMGDVMGDVNAILEYTEGIIAGASFFTYIGQEILKKAKPQHPISRRNFLKGSIALPVAAWAGSPGVLSYVAPYGIAQKDALQRISSRVSGLVSHLHPERTIVFFRNAVMADKLLTIGEYLQKTHGKSDSYFSSISNSEQKIDTTYKPKIGFHAEGQHSGIEDFLLLGPDFCRWIITQFPERFLQEITDQNEGVEKFSTSRLLDITKKGDKFSSSLDTLITDKELVHLLNNKLSEHTPENAEVAIE